MSILFKNATIITMTDGQLPIPNGFLAVDGEKISYVGASRPEGSYTREIDCKDGILIPGLINAHSHIAMANMRGYADDYPLKTWLFDYVFPVEARFDEKAILSGARIAMAEMLRGGTTSFSDMYFKQPLVAKLAEEVGIRASLSNGIVCFDDSTYTMENDRAIAELITLVENYHGNGKGLVRADASIHAEYTSTEKSRKNVLELAHKYGLQIHIHLSETKEEHETCILKTGKTPTELLYSEGIFTAPVLAAHGVWLTDNDMSILAENGASVAHNPVSNLKLGSGIARIQRMCELGINVALGTDGVCSNNSHNMFEEIKLAALLQKGTLLDPSKITAAKTLSFATVNGAKAQGRAGQTGKLEAGYAADITLVSTDAPSMQPIYDAVSTIAYNTAAQDVVLTMTAGKILYENGEFTTIDIQKAKHELMQYGVNCVLCKGEYK